MSGCPPGCNPCRLDQVEKRPGKEQEAVHMYYRRRVECTPGQFCPIGRRKAAKRDEDEYGRHPQMTAPGVGADDTSVSECCFHGTPRFLNLGRIVPAEGRDDHSRYGMRRAAPTVTFSGTID